MFRKFTFLVTLGLSLPGGAAAARPEPNPPVSILTQNMDDGTDQTYIIAALLGALPPTDAIDLTFAELQASDIPGRAELIAAEIAGRKPEIVALQEAALWRIGETPETATTVLFDQLGLLVSSLASRGVPYDVIAVNHLADLAAPGTLVGALRFTDRNAVLLRSDLRPPAFHVSNVHAHRFDATLPFAGLTIPAGWISVDIHRGNTQFRLVATHLESAIPGVPESVDVQVAQAQELLHELRNLTIPVVICGDFNSDALHGGFLDSTPTVGVIEAAGYDEVWPATTHPDTADPAGHTWPYYLEDLFPPPPFFAPSAPIERIDLFFSKGLDPVTSDLVVSPGPPSASAPPFASDHAGVIAVFR